MAALPHESKRRAGRAQRDQRSASDRDFLETSRRQVSIRAGRNEKRERLTVRRKRQPERIDTRSADRLRVELTELPNVDLRVRDESDCRAVGRHCDVLPARARELHAVGQSVRKTSHDVRDRGCRFERPRTGGRDRRDRQCRTRKDEPVTPLAMRHDGCRKTGGRAAFVDPLEVQPQIMGGMKAVVRILLETCPNDSRERRWCSRLQIGYRRWLPFDNRCDQTRLRLPLERPSSRDHFVQHAAEGPNVSARVRFLTLNLLGRHVRKRAENAALRGDWRFVRGLTRGGVRGQARFHGCGRQGDDLFCQAKIEQLAVRST